MRPDSPSEALSFVGKDITLHYTRIFEIRRQVDQRCGCLWSGLTQYLWFGRSKLFVQQSYTAGARKFFPQNNTKTNCQKSV